ncbi:MAG TPA: bacteriohemerythrin [Spirochaetota bacterium]|nr:bacteriohemerythrin [Spirochaetota bacterium]HPI22714.1 bacteriohemerythrin [Spirochaetota bacterium]HPU87548.1 bacteriohemerythrin [Spirochaetota bacterium]
MAFINWNKQYSVGVKLFDDQHFKLVEMANALYEAFKAGRGREALGETFKGLVDYVQVHFTAEEELMLKHEYPQLLRHRQEHIELIARIKDLYGKALSGSSAVSMEMLNFLRDWLIRHIAESDRQYGKFFNDRGVF